MNDRHPALRYVAPVFRVSDLARSIRFSRDQAAFERAEHLDACAVISAARKLAKEFSAAGAPLSVPLRTMPYGIERWLSMASAAATFSGPQFYDEYLGPAWFEAHAAELARRIPRDPPGDVLELACGTQRRRMA